MSIKVSIVGSEIHYRCTKCKGGVTLSPDYIDNYPPMPHRFIEHHSECSGRPAEVNQCAPMLTPEERFISDLMGFVETVRRFFEGPSGPPGAVGCSGSPGEPGPEGPQGPRGKKG